MQRAAAMALFTALEAERYNEEDASMLGNEPIFDVRLDAVTTREDERDFRVRVTLGAIKDVSVETWAMVLRVVPEGATMAVQNAGVELS